MQHLFLAFTRRYIFCNRGLITSFDCNVLQFSEQFGGDLVVLLGGFDFHIELVDNE
jgi:hypothetical protein